LISSVYCVSLPVCLIKYIQQFCPDLATDGYNGDTKRPVQQTFAAGTPRWRIGMRLATLMPCYRQDSSNF
jgi:hypothetical protein